MSALSVPNEREPADLSAIGEHRFGCSPDFSLGIEEELLIVDPVTLELVAQAPYLSGLDVSPGRVTKEIFAAEIELVTPVCRDVGEAAGELSRLRRALRSGGVTALGAGLHPTAALDHVALNSDDRYRAVAADLKGILRTPTAALHVHVGMPDPETAIQVANGMRCHVPLLQALAANSPFWGGVDSGLASARAAILRSYPRTDLPRRFSDWEDFCVSAAALARVAGVPDYTYFWWDVRPHPRLGTVEIRAVDVQSSLERSIALAALIHSLARLEVERPTPNPGREVLAECAYQATRHGLRARLVDDEGQPVVASVLARRRLTAAMPLARELGADGALLGVERILSEGGGADRQRLAFKRAGLPGVLRQLAAETAQEARS